MRREVLPELLDELPVDDPRARRSRRDLRLLNGVMGNHRWMMSQLKGLGADQGGFKLIELGGGDGWLAQRVSERWPALELQVVDLAPRPEGLGRVNWVQGDLFEMKLDFAGSVVLANLFLHHFDAAGLRRLGERLAAAQAFLFNEPARRRRHRWQGKLAGPLLGEVTRHDLDVSVRAGFLGDELPQFLGLSEGWRVEQSTHALGAYRVKGVRAS